MDSLLPIHRPAKSLAELLHLHDTAFVHSAYLTMLGRSVDPDGLAHYRRHLRNGVSKLQMLGELRRSPEGKAYDADLPGLAALLKRYDLARLPLVGPLFAFLFAIDSPTRRAKRQRATLNAIWAVEQELGARLARLEEQVETLGTMRVNAPGGATSAASAGRPALTGRGKQLLGALDAAMAQPGA